MKNEAWAGPPLCRPEPPELICPVCGAVVSAEERLLWRDGRVAACGGCLKAEGFAWKRLE